MFLVHYGNRFQHIYNSIMEINNKLFFNVSKDLNKQIYKVIGQVRSTYNSAYILEFITISTESSDF